MSINPSILSSNQTAGEVDASRDPAISPAAPLCMIPLEVSSFLREIPPTGSATTLVGRATTFVPSETPKEELLDRDRLLDKSLILIVTGLKSCISICDSGASNEKGRILYLCAYPLIGKLKQFLTALSRLEDPEKTLDVILPRIPTEDKFIIYKYLKSEEGLDSIGDLVFKKIVENLKPDLTDIENLLPIFHHPIDEQEWRHLIPLLQSFVGKSGEDSPSIKPSSYEFDAVIKVQILILTAINQAVTCKNPKAISFLLANFPFLKTLIISQKEIFIFNFVNSQQLQWAYYFPNPFYSALKSGDYECVEAFFSLELDIKKKAGAEIIKHLLLKNKTFTEQELSNKWRIFCLLLILRLDPELIIEGPSGIPSTLAETLFMHDCPEVKNFGLHLLQGGATLTPCIVEKMKLELREHPKYERVIIKLLIENGKASVEEIRCLGSPPAPVGSRDALLEAMSRAKITINKLLRKYTGNPLAEDFKELEEIRSLKKEVKKYLVAHREDASCREVYRLFSFDYDTLVTSHYLLSNLRDVSQELRSYANNTRPAGSDREAQAYVTPLLSQRVIALFNLWHPLVGLVRDATTGFILTMDATARSTHFQIVRGNLLKYIAQMNAESFWRDKQVSCVHGTKLVPDMVKERALIPAGMMSDDEGAIVPFSGEHCGSNKHHNKEYISTTKPAKDWGDIEHDDMLQRVQTPMLIPEVYAKQITGSANFETCFDYEASKKRVNWEYINKALFVDGAISNRALQQCGIDILRLRAWDPSHEEYLTPLLNKVSNAIASPSTPPHARCAFQELEKALTVKIKFPLNEADKDLISHPIPIMFASTTYSPITLKELLNLRERNDELLIKGKATFGKDLQAAFVDEQHVAKVRSLLEPLSIAIFPFQIAHAIETERMMRGAHILERSESLATEQTKLGVILQQDILPYYGKLFAERPSYIDPTGAERFVERPCFGGGFPSYAAYKKAVDETTTVPRFIHGKMHAVRTSMAAQLWANVYSAMKGETVAPDRTLLAIAAAAHDSQRQAEEGIDHWDGASGKALQSYLASRGYPMEICLLYAHALIEKDPREVSTAGRPIFSSDVQRLVHDADTLEIMRVLDDKKCFQSTRLEALAVWEECKQKARAKVPAGDQQALAEAEIKLLEISTDLQRLVVDWGKFIDITEKPELKMLLEYTPFTDYYTEVMKILKYLTNKGELSTLKKFLAGELAQVPGNPSIEV